MAYICECPALVPFDVPGSVCVVALQGWCTPRRSGYTAKVPRREKKGTELTIRPSFTSVFLHRVCTILRRGWEGTLKCPHVCSQGM